MKNDRSRSWKQGGVAVLISDKGDFRPKLEKIKKVTMY
jgi:hypothetical protein